DAELLIREPADHDERQHDHGREDRTADAKFCEFMHWVSPLRHPAGCSSTRANIPGLNLPSRFGNSVSTSSERVAGSITPPITVTRPSNTCPGYGSTFAFTGCPLCTEAR